MACMTDKCKALVMQYVGYGAMSRYLQCKFEQNLLDIPFVKFASDIAEGMTFLASKGIIHRDLAARNILVENEYHVKISDFGLAHILKGNDFYKFTSERPLPMKWYAPESISNNIFKHKSDVSLDCLFCFPLLIHCLSRFGVTAFFCGVSSSCLQSFVC